MPTALGGVPRPASQSGLLAGLGTNGAASRRKEDSISPVVSGATRCPRRDEWVPPTFERDRMSVFWRDSRILVFSPPRWGERVFRLKCKKSYHIQKTVSESTAIRFLTNPTLSSFSSSPEDTCIRGVIFKNSEREKLGRRVASKL